MRCPACGKETPPWGPTCANCDAPTPATNGESTSPDPFGRAPSAFAPHAQDPARRPAEPPAYPPLEDANPYAPAAESAYPLPEKSSPYPPPAAEPYPLPGESSPYPPPVAESPYPQSSPYPAPEPAADEPGPYAASTSESPYAALDDSSPYASPAATPSSVSGPYASPTSTTAGSPYPVADDSNPYASRSVTDAYAAPPAATGSPYSGSEESGSYTPSVSPATESLYSLPERLDLPERAAEPPLAESSPYSSAGADSGRTEHLALPAVDRGQGSEVVPYQGGAVTTGLPMVGSAPVEAQPSGTMELPSVPAAVEAPVVRYDEPPWGGGQAEPPPWGGRQAEAPAWGGAPPEPPPWGGTQWSPPPEGAASGPKRQKKPILLVAAVVAAVVVVGGGAYALLGGGDDHAKTQGAPVHGEQKADAKSQASAVEKVVRSGRRARGGLPAIGTCKGLASAGPAFQSLVQARERELRQAKQLNVGKLPGGADLKQALTASYQYSMEADQAYVDWSQEVRQGHKCGHHAPPHTANYNRVQAAQNKAAPAKRRFVARWRPIARQQGLTVFAWSDI